MTYGPNEENPERAGGRAGVSSDDLCTDPIHNLSIDADATASRFSGLLGEPQSLEDFCRDTDALINGTAVLEGGKVRHLAAAVVVAAAQELDGTITQDGVARVFARRYADRLRFDHDAGAWFMWDGARWQRDHKAVAFHFVRELSRSISEGAREAALREVRKVNFAGGVERFAQCDPALSCTSDAWDRDPLLLGTPGGTVNLQTGRTRPADPADAITKLTAVGPGTSADCPRWLQFLDEATGSDADLIGFLQRWCGYCLTGLTREHALVFVYGPGGNGKSVFLNVLTGILADYATTASMDTFTASKSDRHPTDMAMLRGARVVTASETEEGRAWAEAKVKQLTGGDPVSARFMHKDFFTFTPAFKLTVVGNHQPTLKNVDEAIRRRFNIVPFTRKPERPDPQLEEKLRVEWPSILRWMIEGAVAWQRDGLTRPETVKAATDDYFADQDAMAQWLDEHCDAEPTNHHKSEASAELYKSYAAFAQRAGDDPGNAKTFAAALRQRGFVPYRTKLSRGFRGIRLRRQEGWLAEGDG